MQLHEKGKFNLETAYNVVRGVRLLKVTPLGTVGSFFKIDSASMISLSELLNQVART